MWEYILPGAECTLTKGFFFPYSSSLFLSLKLTPSTLSYLSQFFSLTIRVLNSPLSHTPLHLLLTCLEHPHFLVPSRTRSTLLTKLTTLINNHVNLTPESSDSLPLTSLTRLVTQTRYLLPSYTPLHTKNTLFFVYQHTSSHHYSPHSTFPKVTTRAIQHLTLTLTGHSTLVLHSTTYLHWFTSAVPYNQHTLPSYYDPFTDCALQSYHSLP
jgi:hypothetical protein